MPFLLPEKDSLVTYYMLPLVGVNKRVFGRKFIASYISKNENKIFVQVTSKMNSIGYKTPNYKLTLPIEGSFLIMYSIPTIFCSDAALFRKGMYSKISKNAKKLIYRNSTLPYNATVGDFKMSSPILQALDKTKTLRKYLEDNLGIETIPDSFELMEPPSEYWFIESIL